MRLCKSYCTKCFVSGYFDRNDLDPRCYTCRRPRQRPREMVLGDVCDWADSRPHMADFERERYKNYINDFKLMWVDQWDPEELI
jgi:hypothetical protein